MFNFFNKKVDTLKKELYNIFYKGGLNYEIKRKNKTI